MRPFTLLSGVRICEQIGARIKRLRLAQNLTQQQLAQMTQSSLSSVRRLEAKGQGSLEFLIHVALALQAIGSFEVLFEQAPGSIAQLEREQAQALRQRARRPRSIA